MINHFGNINEHLLVSPTHRVEKESSEGLQKQGTEVDPRVSALSVADGFGIDKVRLRALADPNGMDISFWDTNNGFIATVAVPLDRERPDIKVHLTLHLTSGWLAVEFNPARVLFPDATSLCPPTSLRPVVATTLRRLSSLGILALLGASHDSEVTHDGGVSEELIDWVNVTRLDIARDFATVTTAPWLGVMEQLRPSRWTKRYTYGRGAARTVYCGNKDSKFRAYDKQIQTKGTAPRGTLRVELEMHGDWLKPLNMVSSLDPVATTRQYLLRWDHLGLGDRRIGGTSPIHTIAASTLSPARKANLIGQLCASSENLELGLSSENVARARRTLQAMGLSYGQDLHAASATSRCLDLISGAEVDELTPPI